MFSLLSLLENYSALRISMARLIGCPLTFMTTARNTAMLSIHLSSHELNFFDIFFAKKSDVLNLN